MNTSSRVPGITRNSGWQAVHAEMPDRRMPPQPQSPVPDVRKQVSK